MRILLSGWFWVQGDTICGTVGVASKMKLSSTLPSCLEDCNQCRSSHMYYYCFSLLGIGHNQESTVMDYGQEIGAPSELAVRSMLEAYFGLLVWVILCY